MKIFLSILVTFLVAIAGLFGYSYATKGAAKDFIDKLKGGIQIEQPNEKPPSDFENGHNYIDCNQFENDIETEITE